MSFYRLNKSKTIKSFRFNVWKYYKCFIVRNTHIPQHDLSVMYKIKKKFPAEN